jgi:C4-dicarboxylate-specific signal transduction histidine kinase
VKGNHLCRQWYWMPTAVFLLGVISMVLLFGLRSITERQRMAFEQVDDIMDIEVRTTNFHLWFEETLTKGSIMDVRKTFEDLDKAIKFADALLFGGESENGTVLAPMRDPDFLWLAGKIRTHLDMLKELALERVRNRELAGTDSILDERFSAVFKEFQRDGRALEFAVEKERTNDQAEKRRLYFAILSLWAFIVMASILGLYSRELGRRRAEQAMNRAYEEMEQRVQSRTSEMMALQTETLRAAHLALIGKLAAGVAHEINNPINGIINYAKILSNKSEQGSVENDVAERIAKEARRIAGIVRSLLSFARDRKGEKMSVRLEEILRESLTLTESQLKKEGVRLRIDLPPGLPDITANPQQIQQVFMNIINNAQYALNQKYPEEHEDKALDIICEEVATDDGPFVRITFHDRGIGIPPDALDKVMHPFFSTKPRGEGTGLGLSISHGIIADHGGRLAVTSVQGEHTRVLIDLPAAAGREGERVGR